MADVNAKVGKENQFKTSLTYFLVHFPRNFDVCQLTLQCMKSSVAVVRPTWATSKAINFFFRIFNSRLKADVHILSSCHSTECSCQFYFIQFLC